MFIYSISTETNTLSNRYVILFVLTMNSSFTGESSKIIFQACREQSHVHGHSIKHTDGLYGREKGQSFHEEGKTERRKEGSKKER